VVRWGILSFPKAIQTVTLNPARLLGIDNEKGRIAVGALADLVLWDQQTLAIKECWVEGSRQDVVEARRPFVSP
jgi:imidazolonepropionase-like amidohydrolase